MNLRLKFEKVLEKIKEQEKIYSDAITEGSDDINDYIDRAYYGGMHNGFNFVWYALDNHLSEEEFDELVNDLFKQEEIN